MPLGPGSGLRENTTDAKLKATAKLSGSGGSTSAGIHADGSLFAPLPALAPDFRWYPIPSSGPLLSRRPLTGMSFFGYGNFVSGNAVLGFRVGHHWEFAGQPVQDLRRVEQYRNSSNTKRASCRVPQELTRRTEAELCETLFEQNWIRDAQREIPNCRTGDRALSHCERLGVVANVASVR